MIYDEVPPVQLDPYPDALVIPPDAFADHFAKGPVVNPVDFVVKDSGVREEYENGFVRDTEAGKPDFTRLLAIDGLELVPVEMIERWAAHMVKGARKYGVDNWRQARGQVPRDRFLRSLVRHVVQYVRGDRDEDHASAIMFNVAARELVPDE